MRQTAIQQTKMGTSYAILATQGGGISIANIKNPGKYPKMCAIEIYEYESSIQSR